MLHQGGKEMVAAGTSLSSGSNQTHPSNKRQITPQDFIISETSTEILVEWISGDRVGPDCPQNRKVELISRLSADQAVVIWRDFTGKEYRGTYKTLLIVIG
jgi:hypothetical protein